jgi:hypothetical protein
MRENRVSGKLKPSSGNNFRFFIASSLLLVSAVSWSEEEAGQSATSSLYAVSDANADAAPVVSKPKVPNSVVVTDLSFKRETQDFFYDEKINSNDMSTTRQAGYKRIASYGELRGINTDIRAELIKMGYVVMQGKPAVAKTEENDEFFNVVERIRRGDFGDAQFVLFGTVTDVSFRNTKEKIQGTDDFSYGLSVSLLAEFSLIETESLKVVAAFTTQGSGSDTYLGKDNARFTPDNARISKDLLASFNAQSRRQLMQQMPSSRALGIDQFAKPQTAFSGGDPATLKIYKLDDDRVKKDGGKDKKSSVTIYR